MSRKNLICFIMAIVMAGSLLAGITFPTSTVKAEDGLVLHLKFDSDLKDASGTGNDAECTYGQITYTDGIFGKAANFNGKSYIEIADDPSLDLNNFTISLWANKSTRMKSDRYVPYIYKEEDDDTWISPYEIFEFQDNDPYILLHDNSDETEMNQFRMEGQSVDIRKWFLMTVTYDGKEVRYYEDGVLVRKQSVSGTPANSSGSLYIGMKDGEYFFQGEMDDLRIYDRALSASEVTGLYDTGLKEADNPTDLKQSDEMIAYYKFNGDLKDSSRWINDAELSAGKVTYVYGMNDKAVKFSKGTYLEVEDNTSLDFDQGFTLTAWVNLSKSEDMQTLLNKNGVSTSYDPEDLAYRISLDDGLLDFEFTPFAWQGSTSGVSYSFDNSIVSHWTHIAVTFDTEEVRWYMNGKLVQKEEITDFEGSKLAHSDQNLMIGSDGELYFTGAIDEMKMFNYALTADDVKTEAENIDSVSISADNQKSIKTMKVNATVTLTTSRTFVETGKTEKITTGVTYRTSNKKVFTVSTKGVIKAVGKGTATLTVTHGGITKSYKIIVK